MASFDPSALESQCSTDTDTHSPKSYRDYIARALKKYIPSRWFESPFGKIFVVQSSSNMATPPTDFADMVTAAQVASTTNREPDKRASIYVENKGPTALGRTKAKLVKACKSASKSFKKFIGKKERKFVISYPTPATFERQPSPALVDSLTVSFSPKVDQKDQETGPRYSVHLGPDAASGKSDTEKTEIRKSVAFTHPTTNGVHVPGTPATTVSTSSTPTVAQHPHGRGSFDSASVGSSSPLPYEEDMVTRRWRAHGKPGETLKQFQARLDGEQQASISRKPTIPIRSSYIARPQSESQPKIDDETETFVELPRVPSTAPELPPIAPVSPHIRGFDDPKKTFVPGMFAAAGSRLKEVTHSDDLETQEHRAQALNDLQRPASDIVEQSFNNDGRSKGKQPIYQSTGLPKSTHPRLYQSYHKPSSPFNPYGGPAYASSTALPTHVGTGDSRPDTPATSISSPGIPFTSKNKEQYRTFYSVIELEGTYTPGLPPARPANPSHPATPAPAEIDLENVYKNPPLPPAQPTRNTVPARKPVPKPAAAGPSKTAVNVDKALPPSPAPGSTRRFTPMPPRFPPRSDSLNNPVASSSQHLHPRASVPQPQKMNDNGFPHHDNRLSRDFKAPAEYLPRGPMNEMEAKSRDQALKREAEKKAAAAKAKAKADKQRQKQLAKEEKGVRKLCNVQ